MAQQQQRRVWLAGGALAAVALCWYVRRRTRQRSGREVDDLGRLSRCPSSDDNVDGSTERLQSLFDEAVKVARTFPDGMLNQRDQLMLYGLYKQAKVGDRGLDAVRSSGVRASFC